MVSQVFQSIVDHYGQCQNAVENIEYINRLEPNDEQDSSLIRDVLKSHLSELAIDVRFGPNLQEKAPPHTISASQIQLCTSIIGAIKSSMYIAEQDKAKLAASFDAAQESWKSIEQSDDHLVIQKETEKLETTLFPIAKGYSLKPL